MHFFVKFKTWLQCRNYDKTIEAYYIQQAIQFDMSDRNSKTL